MTLFIQKNAKSKKESNSELLDISNFTDPFQVNEKKNINAKTNYTQLF